MWKAPYMSDRYHSGYKYVTVTKTKGSGGKFSITTGTIEDLPLLFIPDEQSVVMRNSEGNIVNGMAEAMVAASWFNTPPKNDDFIIKPDGVSYRIVGVNDFAHHVPAGVYYLYLRRDELAV